MSDTRSLEIKWGHFIALPIIDDYDKQKLSQKLGQEYKFKSRDQWIVWEKGTGEFLPNCHGKIIDGINIW